MKSIIYTFILICFLFSVNVNNANFLKDTSVKMVIDMKNQKIQQPMKRLWEKCVGSGHATLALREDWRKQVSMARKEIGIEMVRFHGILDDDMSTSQGPDINSYVNVDSIVDFLLENNMTMVIELGFMPSWLASVKNPPHPIAYYKGNPSPPANYTQWGTVIYQLASHLVERYGIDEMTKFKFEVWNEPNTLPNGFWSGTKSEYFHLYETAARAVKRVNPRLQVGGPTTSCRAEWIADLIKFCNEQSPVVPLDFITTHTYTGGNADINNVASVTSVLKKASIDAGTLPLIVTEMGSSYIPGRKNQTTGTCHDNYEAASYLARLYHEASTIDRLDVLSYWAISDVFEEGGMPSVNSSFSGDFGMINIYGVPKPAYRLFQLLHQMGNQNVNVGFNSSGGEGLCSKTVNGFAGKNDTDLLIIIYNQAARGVSIADSCSVDVSINTVRNNEEYVADGVNKNLQKEEAIKIWKIDAMNANPMEKWISMGMPQYPTKQENDEIFKASLLLPQLVSMSNNHEIKVNVPAQAVVAITVPL